MNNQASVTRLKLSCFLAITASLSVGLYGEENPLLGKWWVIAIRSTYDPGPAPVREYTILESYGDDGLSFTSHAVMSDKSVTQRAWTAKFDGRDYPVSGDPYCDAVVLKRINVRTLMLVYKSKGSLVRTEVMEISQDGAHMALVRLGLDPQGAAVNDTLVSEREYHWEVHAR